MKFVYIGRDLVFVFKNMFQAKNLTPDFAKVKVLIK